MSFCRGNNTLDSTVCVCVCVCVCVRVCMYVCMCTYCTDNRWCAGMDCVYTEVVCSHTASLASSVCAHQLFCCICGLFACWRVYIYIYLDVFCHHYNVNTRISTRGNVKALCYRIWQCSYMKDINFKLFLTYFELFAFVSPFSFYVSFHNFKYSGKWIGFISKLG